MHRSFDLADSERGSIRMILVSTLTGNGHTPAIRALLDESDIANLQAETVAMIDSIAVFANGLNLAFCSLAILIIWIGLHRHNRWAFWALLTGFTFAILAGIGADYIGWYIVSANQHDIIRNNCSRTCIGGDFIV